MRQEMPPPQTSADRLDVRVRPQPVTRLNRTVIGIVLAIGIVVLLVALSTGWYAPTPPRSGQEEAAEPTQVVRPDNWESLPRSYADMARLAAPVPVPPSAPAPQVPLPPERPASTVPPPMLPAQASGPGHSAGPSLEEQAREERRRKAQEEQARVRTATVFFPTAPSQPVQTQGLPSFGAPVGAGLGNLPLPALPGTAPERPPSVPPDQEEKRTFLQASGPDATTLKGSLQTPQSPYEVQAGTLIPAVLLTGLNSDLPGQILAQVREHVYDTVRGQYLLIPQGSRLIGAYDSAVVFGQDRLLVVWTRLLLPNGDSISLEQMPGVDLAGQAGFKDRVNHHYFRLLSAVVLSSVLGVGARVPAGDVAPGQFFPSLGQDVASNIGQGVNTAGQQIVKKQLDRQPTITVRPGFAVNVFVHRDMVLRPYQDATRVQTGQKASQ